MKSTKLLCSSAWKWNYVLPCFLSRLYSLVRFCLGRSSCFFLVSQKATTFFLTVAKKATVGISDNQLPPFLHTDAVPERHIPMTVPAWTPTGMSESRFLSVQPCVIADCGEHKDGDSWGAPAGDGTGDAHPDFPEDSDVDFKDVSVTAGFDLQGLCFRLADGIRRR